jgi:hypothetical protein
VAEAAESDEAADVAESVEAADAAESDEIEVADVVERGKQFMHTVQLNEDCANKSAMISKD